MGVDEERVQHLVQCLARDEASDAEVEELKLYLEQDPALVRAVRDRAVLRTFGEGWIDRIEADHALAVRERRAAVRVERGVGLTLLAGGAVSTFVLPAVGSVAVLAGLVVLAYSFVRGRVEAAGKDPYEDVVQ